MLPVGHGWDVAFQIFPDLNFGKGTEEDVGNLPSLARCNQHLHHSVAGVTQTWVFGSGNSHGTV